VKGFYVLLNIEAYTPFTFTHQYRVLYKTVFTVVLDFLLIQYLLDNIFCCYINLKIGR